MLDNIIFSDTVDEGLSMTGIVPLVESKPEALGSGSIVRVDDCEFRDFMNGTFFIGSLSSDASGDGCSTFDVRSSVFVNNTGVNLPLFSPECCSGAIDIDASDNSTISIVASEFSNNNATGVGGAVRIASEGQRGPSSVFIESTLFRMNNATFVGALSVDVQSGVVGIQNSIFTGNAARVVAGAVLIEGADTVDIQSSIFTSNTALSAGAVAIDTIDALDIRDSAFTNNTALAGDVGAVFAVNLDVALVANSSFTKNTAAGSTGAIDIQSDTVVVQNTNFSGNNALTGDRGALFVGSRFSSTLSLEIRDALFSNNTAKADGGAIEISFEQGAGNVTIRKSAFSGNTASLDGGAISIITTNIHSGGLANITVDECMFTSNRAGALGDSAGGAMNVGSLDNADLLIHKSSFDMNVCQGNPGLNCTGGGGISVSRLRSLSVSQTNFTDNVCDNVGGGIFSASVPSQTIEECIFGNNSAVDDGGAISTNAAGDLSIVASEFTTNAVIVQASDGGKGGAVSVNEGTNVTLSASMLRGNSAEDSGGALSLVDIGEAVQIERCNFRDNVAEDDGGALFLEARAFSPETALNITDSDFVNNTAGVVVRTSNGGAIFTVALSSTNIESSNFTGNSAQDDGGALSLGDGNGDGVFIGSCTFNDNVAVRFGGAINAINSVLDTISVFNSSFSRNTLTPVDPANGDEGGGIYVADVFRLNVTASSFTANTCEKDGGAIFFERIGSDSFIEDCIFDSNIALDGGGAVGSMSTDRVFIRGSTFSENEASGDGGAVLAGFDERLDIRDSVFANNTSSQAGGAVALDPSGMAFATIDNSSFTGNVASFLGGALNVLGGGEGTIQNITISDSTFMANTAIIGGGVYVEEIVDAVDILGSEFRGNTAVEEGGAIVVNQSSTSTFLIGDSALRRSQFVMNQAGGSGGAVFALNVPSLNVTSSDFELNNSTITGGTTGGGALFYDDAESLSIVDAVFDGNEARKDGGAVFARARNIIVEASRFDNNTASQDGGAVYTIDGSAVNIRDSMFATNTALTVGGALRSDLNDFVVILNSTFMFNEADTEGGAVNVFGSTSLDIRDSTFMKNTALRIDGGAVSATLVDDVDIHNAFFTSNAALADDGGAVAIKSAGSTNVTLQDSRFENNIAREQGGAVFVDLGNRLCIRNSSFRANLAEDSGGAVFGTAYDGVEILNTTFTFNTASLGGGAVAARFGDTFDVRNATFTDNLSFEDGGAVFASNLTRFTCETATFVANIADNGGGVFTQNVGPVNFTANDFVRNRAEIEGGGFGARDSTGSDPLFTNVSNVFIDNTAPSSPNSFATGFSFPSPPHSFTPP